jgi:hypothetical protein
LGGDIRSVSDKLAIKFHLNSSNCKGGAYGFKALISNLNGNVRNTVRLVQFRQLCSVLDINFKGAPKLTYNCGLEQIAGLFVTDGSAHMCTRSSTDKKNDGIKLAAQGRSVGEEKKKLEEKNLIS